MSSFLEQENNRVGGIIVTVLFVISVILILAYFGISYADIAEHPFTGYLLGLFTNFWQ